MNISPTSFSQPPVTQLTCDRIHKKRLLLLFFYCIEKRTGNLFDETFFRQKMERCRSIFQNSCQRLHIAYDPENPFERALKAHNNKFNTFLETESARLLTKFQANKWEEKDFYTFTNLKIEAKRYPKIVEFLDPISHTQAELESRAKKMLEKYGSLKREFNIKMINGLLDFDHTKSHLNPPFSAESHEELDQLSYLPPQLKGLLKEARSDFLHRKENLQFTRKCLDRFLRIFSRSSLEEAKIKLAAETAKFQQKIQGLSDEDYFYLEHHFFAAEKIIEALTQCKCEDFKLSEIDTTFVAIDVQYVFNKFVEKSKVEIRKATKLYEDLESKINGLTIKIIKTPLLENVALMIPDDKEVAKIISSAYCIEEMRKKNLEDLYEKLKISYQVYIVGLFIHEFYRNLDQRYKSFLNETTFTQACFESLQSIKDYVVSLKINVIESHNLTRIRTYEYYFDFFDKLYKVAMNPTKVRAGLPRLENCPAMESKINNPLREILAQLVVKLKNHYFID